MCSSPINFETLRFISILNSLSASFSAGAVPFSKVTPETDLSAIIYDDTKGPAHEYRLVCDKCVDDIHHDIVSYYDDYMNETFIDNIFTVKLINDELEGTYIQIKTVSGNEIIVDEDSWYVC